MKKGKAASCNLGICNERDRIIYRLWEEDIKQEESELLEKDRKLVEHIIEVTSIYQAIKEDDMDMHPNRANRTLHPHVSPSTHG